MSKIKLALIDIDGCLTGGKGVDINLSDIQRIALSQSVPVSICTGRSQPYVEALLQVLGLSSSETPSVVENGCFLYIPKEDMIVINPLIRGMEAEFSLLKACILRKIINLNYAKLEPGKELCISMNPINISIKKLRDMTERVIVDNSFDSVACVSNSNSAVDITPVNVDKGSGVSHLIDVIGIELEDILGVGDSNGDIPMLEKVGICACPNNATEDVKNLVRAKNGYISDFCFTKGVVDILEYFELL